MTTVSSPYHPPSEEAAAAAAGAAVVHAAPHRHRLALQVDVRLASLPRQVFRETFPLLVQFAEANTHSGSRSSFANTPRSAPAAAGPPPQLNLDSSTTSGAVNHQCSGVSALKFASHLEVPLRKPPMGPGVAGTPGSDNSSNLRAAPYSDDDNEGAGEGSHSAPLDTEGAPSAHYESSSASNNAFTRNSNSHQGGASKADHPFNVSVRLPTGVGEGSTLTPVDAGAVASGKRGGRSFSSANNTPNSTHLHGSRAGSRSLSLSASPGMSLLSTRKMSLAHVSVSTFAICRSGAILSYYQAGANPDESELGFSPLNAMNQCAPVNLRGLEKFAILLADRFRRREDSMREERARRAAARQRSANAEPSKKADGASSSKPLHNSTTADTASLDAAAAEDTHNGDSEVKRTPESKRQHHKHSRHHKHHHRAAGDDRRSIRNSHSHTMDHTSEDLDSRVGGASCIFEDAIGWRLERSIDADYVLLRERGTYQCLAFRMRGTRSKHGHDATTVGSTRVSKLDLVAVAFFEPELPLSECLVSTKADAKADSGKPVAPRKPVKQQYLLSEREVLTLTLAGNLLLTEASVVEKHKRDGPASPTTPITIEPTASSSTSTAPQQILQQLQSFTLRPGRTSQLPLPGKCSCFTAWMLENDDGDTLILLATEASGPDGYHRSAAGGGGGHRGAAMGEDGGRNVGSPSAAAAPYRNVLVYGIEKTTVLYEFPLGVPSGISAELMSSPTSRAANNSAGGGSVVTPPLPSLMMASISASVCGFTVVSAHEESAMAIAWTPFQADVLTCCPSWFHFSMFFVTPFFLATINAAASHHEHNSSHAPNRVDPVEDLLSPLGIERGVTGGVEKSNSFTRSSADSESGLLTILCVCPGDRAPHALVGAADKEETEKKRSRKGGKTEPKQPPDPPERPSTICHAEEYLAFFLLSNGVIYALTAPNAANANSGSGSTAAVESGSQCAAHWLGGDLYIYVEDNSSPSGTSPSIKDTIPRFPKSAASGEYSRCSTRAAASPLLPMTVSAEDNPPGPMERELRVVRVGTVFNACFHTPSTMENCAMRYCPVDRDFLDVRGMLYLYGIHASTKELVKDAIVVE